MNNQVTNIMRNVTPAIAVMAVGLAGAYFVYNVYFSDSSETARFASMEPAAGQVSEGYDSSIGGYVGDAVQTIGYETEGAMDDAGDTAGNMMDDAGEAIGDATDATVETVKDAYEATAEAASDAYEATEEMVDDVVESDAQLADDTMVDEAVEDVSDASEDAADTVEDAVEDTAEDAGDAVEEKTDHMKHEMQVLPSIRNNLFPITNSKQPLSTKAAVFLLLKNETLN